MLQILWNVTKMITRFAAVVTMLTIIFISLMVLGSGYIYKEILVYKEGVLAEHNIEDYDYEPALKTEIYSKDGTLLAELFDENRHYVPYSQIPPVVVDALLATEDRRFYEHHGVDPQGIARALASNITSGNSTGAGGSTLTQQISKLLFLSKEKTFERKLKEMFIAFELENKYDKNKIIEIYLNEVFFGQGAYGIESAAQTFFGKSIKDVTLNEATLLVGLPQSPSRYNPLGKNGPEKALGRQLDVLQSMYDLKMITKAEVEAVKAEELVFNKKNSDGTQNVMNMKYPYATSWIISQLKEDYGDDIYSSGWKIYTTIQDGPQEIMNKVASDSAASNKKKFGLENIGMATINPQTGELVAISSGDNDDFLKSQINMGSRPRQPGSTIKPLLYATAMEKGILNDSSIYLDEEINVNGYKPRNVDLKHHGLMTVREAIITSNNIIAVKAGQQLKIGNFTKSLERFGISSISSKDTDLGVSIGGMTNGISPYEMATAYGVLANNGTLVSPSYVSKVLNQRGELIYQKKTVSDRIISEKTAYEMTDILRDVVTYGTGASANFGRDMAGKTGTTNSNRDLWFVGYTPNAVTAVWAGNNDNSKPSKTYNLYSSTAASPAFKSFMQQYTKYLPNKSFKGRMALTPVNIIQVDGVTYLAGKYCIENEGGLKKVKMQSKYVPKETKDCSPTSAKDFIESTIANGGNVTDLFKDGYAKDLIANGYLEQLINAGHFDDLAKGGYVEQLTKAGYTQQLIDKGYLDQPKVEEKPTPPKVEPTKPVTPPKEEPAKPVTPPKEKPTNPVTPPKEEPVTPTEPPVETNTPPVEEPPVEEPPTEGNDTGSE